MKLQYQQFRQESENEFQCKGFMKIWSWFSPGSFKKETEKYLRRFKEFAESQ